MRFLTIFLLTLAASAQDTKYPPDGQQIPGPGSKEATTDWLSEITRSRTERRVRAGLTGEIYSRPELQWTQRSFIQPQSMVEDRYFYDPATRQYTIGRFLDDLDRRRVRVLFPNMPWDQGTRAEARSFAETIAGLMAEIGADGVNGDTYNGVPRSFRMASDATGHPLAFEPEGYPDSDEMLDWDNLTWGYWKYPFI